MGAESLSGYAQYEGPMRQHNTFSRHTRSRALVFRATKVKNQGVLLFEAQQHRLGNRHTFHSDTAKSVSTFRNMGKWLRLSYSCVKITRCQQPT
jgi:hypothetical protein